VRPGLTTFWQPKRAALTSGARLISMTPTGIEPVTCGLGIGPPAVSKVGQGVSGEVFTLGGSSAAVSSMVSDVSKSLRRIPTHVPTPLLTLDQVAAVLAVGRPLVEALVREGGLRVVRIGPELRVRPQALQAFLRASEQ
jgi:excisionase family DNA binding protein